MAEDVRWTDKLPALVIGATLLLAGVVAAVRRYPATAIILLLLGLGFVGYSATVKDWCEVKGIAWGQGSFGGAFGQCLKAKGLLSF